MNSASRDQADLDLTTRRAHRVAEQPPTKRRKFRRIAGITCAVTAVALAAGGVVTYSVLHKSVSVEINGKPTDVSTFASTVSDVLAEENVQYSERDLIAPSLASEVHDGGTIVVQTARKINVEIDGVSTSLWSTALHADEAMETLSARTDGAQLRASRSATHGRASLDLGLGEHASVTVTADGATQTKKISVDSVDKALSSFGIELGERDKVHFDNQNDSLGVTVVRVTTAERAAEVEIPFEATEQEDATLEEGKTQVVQEGQNGIATTNYVTVLEDGVETRRAVLGKGVTLEPVAQITAVGTKAKEVTPPKASAKEPAAPKADAGPANPNTGGAADSLNWPALAKCESNGNPSIVSSNGKYHGLYQFSASTWKSVGGSGVASQASPDEQTMRAKMLYERSGAGQWPHCGKNLFR